MKISKTQIDRAGISMSDDSIPYDETKLKYDIIFDEYRKEHLEPLTQFTISLQKWLLESGRDFYIAQRLKRKPQILRKLKRFSVRLTQLQDIGGCRIIVNSNEEVDNLQKYINNLISESDTFKLIRSTDYREKGRDDSGYRALHLIVLSNGYMLELQIRSSIQHYWSESIERTSVLYGHRLKEQEGDNIVIGYFKYFSDCLNTIETNKRLASHDEIKLQEMREAAESKILESTNGNKLSGYVNNNIILQMSAHEKNSSNTFNNWILVFDWDDGNFVTWQAVGTKPEDAVKAYRRYEEQFPESENKEVVLIGSQNISTVQHTHSHYFGIDHHTTALEGMEKSIIGLSKRSEIDVGARRILLTLKRRGIWGDKKVELSTLKNHFCNSVLGFDESYEELFKLNVLTGKNPVSLDVKQTNRINDLL
ncbi:RelA/SpoT domain-containing protein [Brevundimonas sp.]|uniref:RelA/SpoT domain-containing protein n=1 Tax=Brevundimonas sp. TaxID=1871086 RepID=UPI002FCAD423